ncbi:hypothetical protein [Amycolatopsis sp. FDAARGOS 1241]|uniref:hypothetical protein n=1 Tax=Amycolatopsis sp. FDAARGOS 1241 TaxID=2778070 RepID=UPI0019518B3D|nr:hypothetical protein [Amycolatopsis sp. FDAARGOS 1241]QRP47838.1 hypothetical protein I6J71_07955 [Amycolatopsis sp. FDAARGOS 1241]
MTAAPGSEVTALPSLIRTDSGYRIFNPRLLADGYALTPAGSLVHRHDGWFAGLAVVVFVAPTVALPVLLADGGAWSIALWLVLGVLGGLALAGAEAALCPGDALARHRKRTTEEAELAVTREHKQASRLCALGERIAKSAAWRTGAFDGERRLERLVWGAVLRARRLEESKEDYSEDKRLGLDQQSRAGARRAIAEAEEALAELEGRLRVIKEAADAVEFKVDPARRANLRRRTPDWADPLQDAELLLLEITTMRDYL